MIPNCVLKFSYIILVDYIEKGKIINGDNIKNKWPNLLKKKVPFHKNNVPAYKFLTKITKIYDLGFDLGLHSI